jgi:isopentenyl-diphosphate Delta-isomerase
MSNIVDRKKQHIDIVSNMEVEPTFSPFDLIELESRALPNIDYNEIDTEFEFFNWKLNFPFIISCMTGGEKYGRTINENLAVACDQENVAFGLGSMRIILELPEALRTFDIKHIAPNVPVFGNIGMVQLNYQVTYDSIMKLKDLTKMDGIFFHINALQESIQPEGDTNFKNLIDKFDKVFSKLDFPVIVKEVGHGLDYPTIKDLYDIGVRWFDVAGVGGTSWAKVEGFRYDRPMDENNLGQIFQSFGIDSVSAIKKAKGLDGINIIAGGGLRNGLDIAKSIALGAKMGTSAKPFLKASLESADKVVELLRIYKKSLKIAMFMTNSKNLQELSKVSVLESTVY